MQFETPESKKPGAEFSYGSVFRELIDSTKSLLESEIALARTEIKDSIHHLGNRLMTGVAAGVLLGMSLIPLSAFLVLGLGAILGGNYILSAFIVTLVIAVAGGILSYRLYQQFQKEQLPLTRTRDSLEREREVLSQKIEDIRKAGTRRAG